MAKHEDKIIVALGGARAVVGDAWEAHNSKLLPGIDRLLAAVLRGEAVSPDYVEFMLMAAKSARGDLDLVLAGLEAIADRLPTSEAQS